MGAEYVERLQSVTEALELLGLEVGCLSDLVFRPRAGLQVPKGWSFLLHPSQPAAGIPPYLVVVWDILAESLSLRPSAYFCASCCWL